jgi:hypothetical protein
MVGEKKAVRCREKREKVTEANTDQKDKSEGKKG